MVTWCKVNIVVFQSLSVDILFELVTKAREAEVVLNISVERGSICFLILSFAKVLTKLWFPRLYQQLSVSLAVVR